MFHYICCWGWEEGLSFSPSLVKNQTLKWAKSFPPLKSIYWDFLTKALLRMKVRCESAMLSLLKIYILSPLKTGLIAKWTITLHQALWALQKHLYELSAGLFLPRKFSFCISHKDSQGMISEFNLNEVRSKPASDTIHAGALSGLTVLMFNACLQRRVLNMGRAPPLWWGTQEVFRSMAWECTSVHWFVPLATCSNWNLNLVPLSPKAVNQPMAFVLGEGEGLHKERRNCTQLDRLH